MILSSCGRLRSTEARVKRSHEVKITFLLAYRIVFFYATCTKLDLAHAFLFERVRNRAFCPECWKKKIFTIPWPKVPLSLPAQKSECGIFGPGVVKNSIRSTRVKLASPHLLFAILAFVSGGNLQEIWTAQDFSSIGTILTYTTFLH